MSSLFINACLQDAATLVLPWLAPFNISCGFSH